MHKCWCISVGWNLSLTKLSLEHMKQNRLWIFLTYAKRKMFVKFI